jgi:(p)ppGpp synthase/HD superfamily hydrolase
MGTLLGGIFAVAALAHQFDVDKGGKAYILHCITVMQNAQKMGVTSEVSLALAACHDVKEDHPELLQHLLIHAKAHGVIDEFESGLDLLTRRPDESYEDFIKRIIASGRIDIIRIKKADLKHNSCITRLKGVRPSDIARIQTYHKAWMELENTEKNLNVVI